jgi:hypothetical protein
LKIKMPWVFLFAAFALMMGLAACGGGSSDPAYIPTINDEDFGTGAGFTTITVTSKIEWENAINTIRSGGDNQNYVINVTGSLTATEAVDGFAFASPTFNVLAGITVSLRGGGAVSIGATNGSVLNITVDQTLILRDITLKGKFGNDLPVVFCRGGTLKMYNGATISDNEGTEGLGVYVANNGFINGAFTMYGGAISNNTGMYGGGVVVMYSVFTMYGGTISGNTSGLEGGGVGGQGSEFTMYDGTISGNTADNGGGVGGPDVEFTMHGGTISGNTATRIGGGVFSYDGAITKTGGTIYGNTGDSNANIAKNNTGSAVDTWGHAVLYENYEAPNTYYYYHDATLDDTASGNISTSGPLPATSGAELNGWTMK